MCKRQSYCNKNKSFIIVILNILSCNLTKVANYSVQFKKLLVKKLGRVFTQLLNPSKGERYLLKQKIWSKFNQIKQLRLANDLNFITTNQFGQFLGYNSTLFKSIIQVLTPFSTIYRTLGCLPVVQVPIKRNINNIYQQVSRISLGKKTSSFLAQFIIGSTKIPSIQLC